LEEKKRGNFRGGGGEKGARESQKVSISEKKREGKHIRGLYKKELSCAKVTTKPKEHQQIKKEALSKGTASPANAREKKREDENRKIRKPPKDVNEEGDREVDL